MPSNEMTPGARSSLSATSSAWAIRVEVNRKYSASTKAQKAIRPSPAQIPMPFHRLIIHTPEISRPFFDPYNDVTRARVLKGMGIAPNEHPLHQDKEPVTDGL